MHRAKGPADIVHRFVTFPTGRLPLVARRLINSREFRYQPRFYICLSLTKHFPKRNLLYFYFGPLRTGSCQERKRYKLRLAFSLFHQGPTKGRPSERTSLKKGKCASILVSIEIVNLKEWEWEYGLQTKRCNPTKWVAMQLRGDTCTF